MKPSRCYPFQPILVALLLLSLLTGCFTVPTYAPYGEPIRIMAPDEPAQVRRVYRTWFMFGGLVPLDNTMPAEIIAREKLTSVRVIVEDNIQDAGSAVLATILLPLFILPQTVIVEGNREPIDSQDGSHKADPLRPDRKTP
jgi:hypothetical protein